jgi:hypothetical protein
MNLKTLLKYSKILLLSSILILQACTFCSEEEMYIIESAEEGNLEVVKEYLENGGDPLLECCAYLGRFGYPYVLYHSISISESLELIEYYLFNYDIPQNIKDEFLLRSLFDQNEIYTKKVLNQGGLAFGMAKIGYYYADAQTKILKLIELGYDINTLDEEGNTLFMRFCRWPAPEDEDDLLSMLAFLIEHGAKTDVKNKKGKTAKDLAVNQNVKKFLETL